MNDWSPPPTPAQALAAYTGKGPAYTVPNINGRVIHPDPAHTVVLAYTYLDDGVWLECNDCPWKHNLGFSATPEEAVEAAHAHRGDIAAVRPDADCRAIRWNGTPAHHGPHPPHTFTYGPHGVYIGHCGGRR